MLFKDSFTYDDILLEPAQFVGKSRSEIDLTTNIMGYNLTLPIISAPMNTVTNQYVASQMEIDGGLGIVDRFNDPVTNVGNLIHNGYRSILPIGLMIGDQIDSTLQEIMPDGILIEVAHAHQSSVLRQTEYIRNKYPNIQLMVGNIATVRAAKDLAIAGADCVKVGIGPGRACCTREVTGCGVPQGSAVYEISQELNNKFPNVRIVADGGIRSSGDIVKALALGADAVMLGSIYAAALDSPANNIEIDGVLYKEYYGMASDKSQSQRGVTRAAEGVSGKIRATKTIKEINKELKEGIQSGLSYLGFTSLKELKENRHNIVARKLTQGSMSENGTI